MTVNIVKELNKILENMDSTDANVIAMKALLDSYTSGTNLYMLRYNGKYLTYSISTNSDDAEFCNSYVCYLSTDGDDPIWTTNDIRVAVYNKYCTTEWYNSDTENVVKVGRLKDINPEEIEIVDVLGRVYNRKPLTLKTKAIIYDKIYGDDWLVRQIDRDPSCANNVLSLGEQRYILEEAKEKYNKRLGKNGKIKIPVRIGGLNLDQLYNLRKDLVKVKGQLIRENKSLNRVQKKLDSVNKKIIKLGGR